MACGSQPAPVPAPSANPLTVSAPELASGVFPKALTCDGQNRPPDVSVGQPQATVKTLVFELLDPDAPGGTFTHWLRYSVLDQNAFHEGVNSFGKVGYSGPCPPSGQTHHYHLVVLAVDRRLSLQDGYTRAQLEAELAKGSILSRGEIVATYRR